MKKPLGSLQGHFYTNSNLNIKGTFVALFLSRLRSVFVFVLSIPFCHPEAPWPKLQSTGLWRRRLRICVLPLAGSWESSVSSLHPAQELSIPCGKLLPTRKSWCACLYSYPLWTPGCGVSDTENWLLKPMSNVRVDKIGLNNLCLLMSSFCFV